MKSSILLFIAILILGCTAAVQQSNGALESNWPSFRGHNASGIAEGFETPVSWDLPEKRNIKWCVEMPGLAHASPIIWDDRIFAVTAISGKSDPEMKVGLYGSIEPVEDETVHDYRVMCLDKHTGETMWDVLAHRGVPEVKRHPKSTHANSTPVTDGRHVVAFFGSEGVYCYDMKGALLWKKDFGVLDSGFFVAPDAQWGFASSPILHEGVLIIQADVLENSFLAAIDVATGEELWKTARNDVPAWSTPSIHAAAEKTQVIVNGFKHIGGYDFYRGEELWRLSGGGDIPVPTPVIAHDLVFINGAHGRMSPIFAIRPSASGDISLDGDRTSNEFIVWSVKRGGAYMQTPLVYGEYLYNLRGNGSLQCYRAASGELVYSESVGDMDSFSASGVAADGKLYFSSESGYVYVVKAGPEFEVLSANRMDDICMATPAVSAGTLFFRTHHYLVAVADE